MTLCCAMLCLYLEIPCLIMYRSAKPRFTTFLVFRGGLLRFGVPHSRGGLLSMANASWLIFFFSTPRVTHQVPSVVPRVPTKTIFTSQAGPDNNGSQFFITTAAAHHLDGMDTQAALKENMTVSPCITHMMVNHW